MTDGGGGGSSASANWKLDDDDGGKGLPLNSQNRAMLMAKLGQAAGIQVPVADSSSYHNPYDTNNGGAGGVGGNPMMYSAPAPPVPVIPIIAGVPSTCFVIRNMFDLTEEVASGDSTWD